MDNFFRKVCVEKIVDSLGELSDSKLVTATYFLFTHAPYYDLTAINDHTLKLT